MHDGKGESLRHHAHDCVRRAAEAHCLSEDTGIAVELTLPQLVADDENGRRTGTRVFVEKCPPDERRHARQPEPRRSDGGDPDELHASVLGDEVAFVVAESAQLHHRLRPVVPLAEIKCSRSNVIDPARARGAGAGYVPVADHDDAVARLDRDAGVEE